MGYARRVDHACRRVQVEWNKIIYYRTEEQNGNVYSRMEVTHTKEEYNGIVYFRMKNVQFCNCSEWPLWASVLFRPGVKSCPKLKTSSTQDTWREVSGTPAMRVFF